MSNRQPSMIGTTKTQKIKSLVACWVVVTCSAWFGLSESSAQQTQPSPAASKSTYIGLRHGPELPRGLKNEGGGLITDPYKDKTQFGIAHVTRGRDNFLWFELGTHHNAAGQAFWEVLDVVALPALRRNQIVMYTLCLLNDKPDPEIAAIIEPVKPGSYDTRTLRAWRANRQTRKFEEIPVKGVKCEMQGDD